MDAAPTETAATKPTPGRLGLYAAGVISALVFGWLLAGWLRPADPLAAVAIVNHHQPALMALMVAGVSVLLAGVTSVWLGAGRPYAGMIVVAVGWAVLRVRGGGIESFVFQWAPEASAQAGRGQPFLTLMLETAAWSAIGLAVLATCWGVQTRVLRQPSPAAPAGPRWWELRRTVLCAAIAVIIICVAAGPVTSQPRAGQALFAIILGFYLSSLVALAIKPPGNPAWCFVAVPIVALIGYALAWLHPTLGVPFVNLPNPVPNPLARALPIDYLAAGLSGCVLARWTVGVRGEDESA